MDLDLRTEAEAFEYVTRNGWALELVPESAEVQDTLKQVLKARDDALARARKAKKRAEEARRRAEEEDD